MNGYETRAWHLSLGQRLTSPGLDVDARVPFSSTRKWSAVTFAGRGTWILGAPEVIAATMPGASSRHRPATRFRGAECSSLRRAQQRLRALGFRQHSLPSR